MYEDLVKSLRTDHDKYFARDMEAADAIESVSKAYQMMAEAYRKGYNDGIEKGSLDVKERVSNAYQDGYAKGLEDAWETACRIVKMDMYKRAEVFLSDSLVVTYDEPFKHYSAEEAIQKLKEYNAIMHQITHSNAEKFVEVFGFAPGYEILDDGRKVCPSLNDEWWNAEYKEPEEEE